MSSPDNCPRCGCGDFREVECGPDGCDDDIFYLSYICQRCELYYSGWTDKWLVDCESWRDEEIAEEYAA